MPSKLPPRYTYTLKQTLPGRWCLLTRDCQALALAFGAPVHNFGSVRSDEERDPATLHSELGIEKGVIIERRDNWAAAVDYVDGLREIYGSDVTDEQLERAGFGTPLADAALAAGVLSGREPVYSASNPAVYLGARAELLLPVRREEPRERLA